MDKNNDNNEVLEKPSTDDEEKDNKKAEETTSDSMDNIENAAEDCDHIKSPILNNYKDFIDKTSDKDQDDSESADVDELKQAEKNYGYKFDGSTFNNSTFIINNANMDIKQNERTDDVVTHMIGDDKAFLDWCARHYMDNLFVMFLAACVLDKRPYEDISRLAEEISSFYYSLKDKLEEKDTELLYKSKIVDKLGLIEYQDVVLSRGGKSELTFLRFPTASQVYYIVILLISEFPELKSFICDFMLEKVLGRGRSNKEYILMNRAISILSWIGQYDITFFNDYVLSKFFTKRTVNSDFFAGYLLSECYKTQEMHRYVIHCVMDWRKVNNNPHYSLTALYICSFIGYQDNMVESIFNTILKTLIKELKELDNNVRTPYLDMLRYFYRSGERKPSFYIGLINAVYSELIIAENTKSKDDKKYVNYIFLLLVMIDYNQCDINRQSKRKRSMILVTLYEKLNEDLRYKLIYLWKEMLLERNIPAEGWNILESYLLKYDECSDEEVERFYRFFLALDSLWKGNRIKIFLSNCYKRVNKKVLVAGTIYNKMKEDT